MIVLSKQQIEELLPISVAIEKMREIMPQVSAGDCNLPLRNAIDVGTPNRLGIMPGTIPQNGDQPACFGVKLISLYPDNPSIGKSSHLGSMMLFDSQYGEPIALMDAGILTAIRTAAASALATMHLSREDSQTLVLVGTGEQAEFHLEAIQQIRDIKRAIIVGRDEEKARKFILNLHGRYTDIQMQPSQSVENAVAQADIICSVTSSAQVVLEGDWVKSGTHVNAVGASIPTMQEIDFDLVAKSRLFVDYITSALAQAGDIIGAIKSGLIDETHITGEIGQVIIGSIGGRTSANEITLYRSLGVAAQDLVCARYVHAQAIANNIGTEVKLD